MEPVARRAPRMARLAVVAVVTGLVAGAATNAFGTFTASTNAVHPASTSGGSPPTDPACKWEGMADLNLAWTPAAEGDGTDVLRSTTQGSGHSSIGTATPLGNDTYNDTTVNPTTALPQEYFYVLKTMIGAWRSSATSELRTSQCPGYLSNYAGSWGEHASNPAAVAMQPKSIMISGTTMYVVDQWHILRAINMSTGAVSVVAGNQISGFAGDGGPAALALFNSPAAVAVDSAGNRYVTDNRRIRKITAAGTISTIAGTGANCTPSTAACGDGGAATAATFSALTGIVVDANDHVLVADSGTHRIRRIDAGTGNISTVAGNGNAAYVNHANATSGSFNAPNGLAFDSSGNLYVADTTNGAIRKVATDGDGIDGDAGEGLTTIAGGAGAPATYGGDSAAATSAEVATPTALYVDGSSNVDVVDETENRIRRVVSSNASTIVGTGGTGWNGDGAAATIATITAPIDAVRDADGNLYVVDAGANRVRIVRTDGTISTFAGSGSSTYSGDGGPAVAAGFETIRGMTVDEENSIYVSTGHRVRKITRTGMVTTFAGDGSACSPTTDSCGDGGNAASAKLNTPRGLAWETTNNGRLWIADSGTNRIRRVATTAGTNEPGAIDTRAGTGTAGNTGDGANAVDATLDGPWGVSVVSSTEIYVADTGNHRVRVFSAASGGDINHFAGNTDDTSGNGADGAPGGVALNAPRDVYGTSSTAVYIADTGNKRVRFYNGTNLVSFFGDGTATSPSYAGDGGPATSAAFSSPYGLAVDQSNDDVYVAENGGDRVRKISGGTITTFAGTGATTIVAGDGVGTAPGNQVLRDPTGVAISGSDIYIAENGGNRIRKIAGGTTTSTYAGTGFESYGGDGAGPTTAQFKELRGLAFDGSNNLYMSDSENHRVRVHSTGTGNVTTFAGDGNTGGTFGGDWGLASAAANSTPSDVARDTLGNTYVVERGANMVRKITLDGRIYPFAGTGAAGYRGDGGAATSAWLNAPDGIAIDSSNNVYISDTGNHCVRKVVPSTGIITTFVGLCGASGNAGDTSLYNDAGVRLNTPMGLLWDENGDFYIADYGNDRVRYVEASDSKIYAYAGTGTEGDSGDGGQATSAELRNPTRLARDPGGNWTFIADTGNHRVRRVSSTGNISARAGNGTQGNTGDGATATNGTMDGPRGLAWDNKNSTLYIADTGNHRIRKVGAGGQIDSVSPDSPTDTPAYAGDGGPYVYATVRYSSPDGLAYFIAGGTDDSELLVADRGNHRVRHLDLKNGYLHSTSGTGSAATFGGDGGAATSAQLLWPAGITRDAAGNTYIADEYHFRVRKVTSGGTISTIAGDGIACGATDTTCGTGGSLAVNSRLIDPIDVAVDPVNGDVFIAEFGGHKVVKIDGSTGVFSLVAGDGVAGSTGDGGAASSARVWSPRSVTVYGGELYISEWGGHRVRKIARGGDNVITGADTISTVVGTGTAGGSGDGGAATSATITAPADVEFDASGNLYVVEWSGYRIRKVTAGVISTIAGSAVGYAGDGGGAPGSKMSTQSALALDSTGNLYVASGGVINLDLFGSSYRVRRIYEADSWTP